MKQNPALNRISKLATQPSSITILAALILAASCATHTSSNIHNNTDASFTQAKQVLERNCVNCHANLRLPNMPSLTDTNALAALIGPGKLIIPGKPEQSRLYVVVTLADDQAGAMPPTGHAISKQEVATLRKWIEAGALLPSENIKLNPQGRSPRSR